MNVYDLLREIGQRFLSEAQKQGYSVKSLAKKLGKSERSVNRFICGGYGANVQDLVDFAAAVNCNVEVFFTSKGQPSIMDVRKEMAQCFEHFTVGAMAAIIEGFNNGPERGFKYLVNLYSGPGLPSEEDIALGSEAFYKKHSPLWKDDGC